MSHYSRMQKALGRHGVALSYENGVYHLSRAEASARVLLPADLPLEEKAVEQLLAFASVRSPDGQRGVKAAWATPDFHPGTIAPVGTVVATDADFVIPASVGTDIACGMRLIRTGLRLADYEQHRERIITRLRAVLLDNERNVPLSSAAFCALFDGGPLEFLDCLPSEGLWQYVDVQRIARELEASVGLADIKAASRHAPEALVGGREVLRDPQLGTPGSGNHFIELQCVEKILDRHAAYSAGIALDEVVIMIHTGSRDVGFYVGGRWMDRAREAWPAGRKHPASGLYGLEGALAQEYLLAMGSAARYAWLNRVVLTELIRRELKAICGKDDSSMVVEVSHNIVTQEQGMNIHRKGATPAHAGQLALIPGSMGDASFLVMGQGHPDWLCSCSHGAGRRMRRQAMRHAENVEAAYAWHCVTLREERRVEEAPQAYKPIGPVIEAQEQAGLINAVARMRPLVSFKA